MENMAGEHKNRQYWKHGLPRDADRSEVVGLDNRLYTMYIPSRSADTQRFWDEFDRLAMLQLERARGVLGYRPLPKELIKLRRSYGESAELVEEDGGLGIFHVGGRCAELLALAMLKQDKRYELQGIGTGEVEGSVFLIRTVSRWTRRSCRKRREKNERKRREKGKGKDDRNKDQGPPVGGQAGPSHDAKASAFRTVNSGHWAASRNGPWAFGGARQA